MAEVTKGTAAPSPVNLVTGRENSIGGLYAGEAIAAGDVVYIKASDGKVWKCTGAAANEAAEAWGMAPGPASAGDPVSIWFNQAFGYKPLVGGSPKGAGAKLYVSGTVAGGLADVASVGGTKPVARVIDTDGRIYVLGVDYHN